MPCDATTHDELIAGDDWEWSYTIKAGDDASNWSDPVIELRAGPTSAAELLASNQGAEPTIITDGGFEGTIPATSFDDGIFAWWIASDTTTALVAGGSRVAYLEVSVKIDGVEKTVWPATAYTLRPQVAVREVGS